MSTCCDVCIDRFVNAVTNGMVDHPDDSQLHRGCAVELGAISRILRDRATDRRDRIAYTHGLILAALEAHR